jgi:hypothetical protein
LANPNPNVLIVEGQDDKFAVVSLMEHHVTWPDGKANAPVFIDVSGGVGEILNEKYISTQIKRSGLKRLGLMLDADTNPGDRYARLKKFCSDGFPNLPERIGADGVCVEHNGVRLGIWIMPDNGSEGYLESFLKYLVPPGGMPVWDHATASLKEAKDKGATCKDVHLPKACLYTWLAWQDEPGQSPGRALTKKILDPHQEHAERFIRWFCELYELPRVTQQLPS